MEGREPSTQSFMELQTGSLIVSAIKPAEHGKGLVIRLWNPTAQARTETLRFWKHVANATMLRLNEEPDPKSPRPKRSGRSVTVQAAPHRIVTLGLAFE
jgi:mannosylglycerate hydrolase